MASTQVEQNKDVVNEKIKLGAQTAGKIHNNTKSPLIFSTSKDWAGVVTTPYPGIIQHVGKFVHASDTGVIGQFDEAAVVYVNDKSNHGWLLAWSVAAHPVPDGWKNKIYVEAGPLEKLTKWDDIKAKLEASGSVAHFVDNATKSEIHAQIYGIGSYAELDAIFHKHI